MKLLPLFLAMALPVASQASVTVYTNQNAYLAALGGVGLDVLYEGFEDDAAWGDVRTTFPIGGFNTASSVESQGLVWSSNFPGGGITTGNGAYHSGSWGFYSYPHGSYGTGASCTIPGECGDGFVGTASQGLYAIGGWIDSNTPPAEVSLFLDGVEYTFGAAGSVSNFVFLGAISTTPFTTFEYREMEGLWDEAKYLFADQFYFALAPVPEPGTWAMMLAGLGLMLPLARRRVKAMASSV